MDIRKFFTPAAKTGASPASNPKEAGAEKQKPKLDTAPKAQVDSVKEKVTKKAPLNSPTPEVPKKVQPPSQKDPIEILSDDEKQSSKKSSKVQRNAKQSANTEINSNSTEIKAAQKSRKRKAVADSDSESEQPKRAATRKSVEKSAESSSSSVTKGSKNKDTSPKEASTVSKAKSAESKVAEPNASADGGKLTKLAERGSSAKQADARAIEISDSDDAEEPMPIRRGRQSRKRVDSSSSSESRSSSPRLNESSSPVRGRIDFYVKPASKLPRTTSAPQATEPAPKSVDPAAFFNSNAIVRTDRKTTPSAPVTASSSSKREEPVRSPTKSNDAQPIEKTSKKPEVELETTPTSKGKTSTSKASTSPSGNKSNNATGKTDSGSTQRTPVPPAERRAGYLALLNREGPRQLGARTWPTSVRGTLTGLTFVLTGEMETITRDDAKRLIEACDGKVTGSVSRRTTYLVVGRDAGASKSSKATELGVRTLDEEALFVLLQERLGAAQPAAKRDTVTKSDGEFFETDLHRGAQQHDSPPKAKFTKAASAFASIPDTIVKDQASPALSQTPSSQTAAPATATATNQLWVDKYRPSNLKQLVGQQGDRSCAQKLVNWLRNWNSFHSTAAKAKAGPKTGGNSYWAARNADDGRMFKAALLSGPAGIGKTSAATVCCREAGLHIIELNASDKRSKKNLGESVAETMHSYSLSDLASHSRRPQHCLIMDEVDGMSGNEDRGGVQELIQLIKTTRVPILCICNDRQHPKIRSLSNYCFDLRFTRPRIEQVFAALLSIAFKEGFTQPKLVQMGLTSDVLNEMILATSSDIRQSIHNLQMVCGGARFAKVDKSQSDTSSSTQSQSDSHPSQQAVTTKARFSGLKDVRLSPFDVCRLVFTQQNVDSRLTIMDRFDLFFSDSQIAPLFVFENYPIVTPTRPMQGAAFPPTFLADTSLSAAAGINSSRRNLTGSKPKTKLDWMALAADSISFGDLVEHQIRETSSWNLMPVQALFASVLPGEYMHGSIGSLIQFPTWFGRNSTANKNRRVLQQCAMHASIRSRFTPETFSCDCVETMRHRLIDPLLQRGADGVDEIVDFATSYYLLKEDVDGLLELFDSGANGENESGSSAPNPKDWRSRVEPKVKAALTRAFNKSKVVLPYVLEAPIKKNRGKATSDDVNGEEDEEGARSSESSDAEDDALDAMVKAKVAPAARSAPKQQKQSGATTSKAAGKGKKK